VVIEAIRKILKDYWGYDHFRALQEEIILSVLTGNDTLALLPTGGGKSICFQVPAMYKDGLCLVITPLIALMKDQVENLKKRKIQASAIFSGMNPGEIERTFDFAAYGKLKFLYVSPERLQTSLFEARAQSLPINMIAIDEAHCISEWGYDFRPSYLKIADIRKFYPKVPFLALTASATKEVRADIISKLRLNKPNYFQKSFERENLIYGVVFDEAKYNKLKEISSRVHGCGIVYVRTRKQAKEVSDFLNMNKINSDFYHAGLEQEERNKKQDAWKSGKTRIIVATNAFGMGIDKPNVRLVVHMHLPDSLEAYYQEAGRAGRDLQKSFAIAIINKLDKQELEKRMETNFPERSYIQTVYQAIGNYCQIPIGSGLSMEFDFNLADFCSSCNFDMVKAYNAIRFIEKEELLYITEQGFLPARLFITVNYHELYDFQLQNPDFEPIIKTLLRSYEGLFDVYVRIHENDLARQLGIESDKVINKLKQMDKKGVCHYLPAKNKPQLVFLCNRLPKDHVMGNLSTINKRKEVFRKKMDAISEYAYNFKKCRSITLLEYFSETLPKNCGHCDFCLKAGNSGLSSAEFEQLYHRIKEMIDTKSHTFDNLKDELTDIRQDKLIAALKWMKEQTIISEDEHHHIYLN